MMKKVDDRIQTLIENGVTTNQKSFFIIVGDKSHDQIVNLHHMLAKSYVFRPTVLWRYKLQFVVRSAREIRRANRIKKLRQKGLLIPDNDPFRNFLGDNDVTFLKYGDPERILGKTFDMCVLKDSEDLTPNLLARSIETVIGGGLVALLLRSHSSLTSLYTMVTASGEACVVMDDKLNIFPISPHIKPITKDLKDLQIHSRL